MILKVTRRCLCDPMFSSTVLVQYRLVTDRQTDGRSQGHSIYRATVVSHGKNSNMNENKGQKLKITLCRLLTVRVQLRMTLTSACTKIDYVNSARLDWSLGQKQRKI